MARTTRSAVEAKRKCTVANDKHNTTSSPRQTRKCDDTLKSLGKKKRKPLHTYNQTTKDTYIASIRSLVYVSLKLTPPIQTHGNIPSLVQIRGYKKDAKRRKNTYYNLIRYTEHLQAKTHNLYKIKQNKDQLETTPTISVYSVKAENLLFKTLNLDKLRMHKEVKLERYALNINISTIFKVKKFKKASKIAPRVKKQTHEYTNSNKLDSSNCKSHIPSPTTNKMDSSKSRERHVTDKVHIPAKYKLRTLIKVQICVSSSKYIQRTLTKVRISVSSSK